MPDLAHAAASPDLTLGTPEFRAVLRLKSWLPAYVTGGQPVVLAGRELPAQVGGVLAAHPRVLCVGPGEWLLVAESLDSAALRQEVKADLDSQGLVLVDVSQSLAVIRLAGAAARAVLAAGCGLDLHPRSFAPERCARTRFAAVAAVLQCCAGESNFELYVARSHAAYVRTWLADAAAGL